MGARREFGAPLPQAGEGAHLVRDSARSAFRLDTVAHGAEAGEGIRPLVARGAGDDAQRGTAAREADPLHHRDSGLVLAADAVDPGLEALLAVDADRLGH